MDLFLCNSPDGWKKYSSQLLRLDYQIYFLLLLYETNHEKVNSMKLICNKMLYFLDHNWELHCKKFLQFNFCTQFTYPWSALSKIETCNEKYSLQLFSETTKKQSSYSKYKREKIWNFSFTCTYFLKNIKLIF